jgi:hypothetical protein
MTSSALSTVELVGFQPVAAADLHERYRFRCSVGTVSKHLSEADQEGLLDRRWDGNQRFGRWLYSRKVEGGER